MHHRVAAGVAVMGRLLALLALLGLLACSGPRPQTAGVEVTPTPTPDWPGAVGTVPLLGATMAAVTAIEVGVLPFPAADPASLDEATLALRRVESTLLAAQLRDTLVATEAWGAVRVLPSPSAITAVTVSGQILHSDGRDLVLAVTADDAAGRRLLAGTYRDSATDGDYPVVPGADPFRDLFNAIANDLLEAVQGLGEPAVTQLPTLASLRYAQSLVPEAFAGYVVQEGDGYRLSRLPADNDPMLARVDRVRNQEYLFIDTVDEQFVDLRNRIGPTYALWRQSTKEQADYLEDYQSRAGDREVTADRGSFAAMQQVYATYRSVKVQEQDLFEYATGFGNEVAPTVVAAGDRVVRLEGTLEAQYAEWRRLLASIFRLESGLTP